MMNIVLALTLTLSAAALASVPVAAAEQEKDRCVLTEDPAEKIADCRKLPRKNASRLDKSARKIGALCPNDELETGSVSLRLTSASSCRSHITI